MSIQPSPKRFTQPQLAACVLLTFYTDLSYRNMEDRLLAFDKVDLDLELTEVPDHSTLSRIFKKMRMKDLETLNQRPLEQLEVEEDTIAIDSTGLSQTHPSQHYLSGSSRIFKFFVKAFFAVGNARQYITVWCFDWEPDRTIWAT